jgi:nitroreductase
MATKPEESLQDLFGLRFGTPPPPCDIPEGAGALARLAARCSHRRYLDRPVYGALIETLAAAALSAPTKSDLQQGDIVIVRDSGVRAGINALFPADGWIGEAIEGKEAANHYLCAIG